MKNLQELVIHLQERYKPRDTPINFDKRITQDQVKGDVLYTLSGGDGIALKVFPNAERLFYIDEHPFESTKEEDFTYFDESMFSKIVRSPLSKDYLQAIGVFGNGYDYTQVEGMYWRAEILNDYDIDAWKIHGIATLLLGRLRVVYGAEILNIEKIQEKIYKIDFYHNDIHKSLYYISHKFNVNSDESPEIKWLEENANFKALLIKAVPFIGKPRLYLREAITNLIKDGIEQIPKEFTIVSDCSMTNLNGCPFDINKYKHAGFEAFQLENYFGYNKLSLVTNGQMLLDPPKKNAPFLLSLYQKTNGQELLDAQEAGAPFSPSSYQKKSYLNKIYMYMNMGNIILDFIKVNQVGTNYYKIQAAISFSKAVSLYEGNNALFSLSNSAEILNDYYWGKSPKEDFNTLALKWAVGLASIALYYSPYTYGFKILATYLSIVNFAYNAYETNNDITHSIKTNICKLGDESYYNKELNFLQFKNIGAILIKEGFLPVVFIEQQELIDNPIFMEYMSEHCDLGPFAGNVIYQCQDNNNSWEAIIMV